jgi:hypothetical protein
MARRESTGRQRRVPRTPARSPRTSHMSLNTLFRSTSLGRLD